jgi:HD-GYP domain-containing protein (c-di-GMP phosphodiesterase class II)
VPDALAELHRCAGTQFDPAVVTALIRVVDANTRSSSAQRLAA